MLGIQTKGHRMEDALASTQPRVSANNILAIILSSKVLINVHILNVMMWLRNNKMLLRTARIGASLINSR